MTRELAEEAREKKMDLSGRSPSFTGRTIEGRDVEHHPGAVGPDHCGHAGNFGLTPASTGACRRRAAPVPASLDPLGRPVWLSTARNLCYCQRTRGARFRANGSRQCARARWSDSRRDLYAALGYRLLAWQRKVLRDVYGRLVPGWAAPLSFGLHLGREEERQSFLIGGLRSITC